MKIASYFASFILLTIALLFSTASVVNANIYLTGRVYRSENSNKIFLPGVQFHLEVTDKTAIAPECVPNQNNRSKANITMTSHDSVERSQLNNPNSKCWGFPALFSVADDSPQETVWCFQDVANDSNFKDFKDRNPNIYTGNTGGWWNSVILKNDVVDRNQMRQYQGFSGVDSYLNKPGDDHKSALCGIVNCATDVSGSQAIPRTLSIRKAPPPGWTGGPGKYKIAYYQREQRVQFGAGVEVANAELINGKTETGVITQASDEYEPILTIKASPNFNYIFYAAEIEWVPTVVACNEKCTKDNSSACDAASTQVPGCVCVLDPDNVNGICQVCPVGTTYNPTTKKCEPATPPPAACAGACSLTDSTSCDAGKPSQNGNCYCVKQADNQGQCQSCPSGTTYNPITKSCEPTTVACNQACTRTDSSACDAAASSIPGCVCILGANNINGQCGVCPVGTTYNPTTKKCEPATPPPAACAGACSLTDSTSCDAGKPSQNGNCYCVKQADNQGQCQSCPSGTTYNPTTKKCEEPFRPDMCKCDSVEVQGKITPGQKVTFVAYAKVEGDDVNRAEVESLQFHVYRDTFKLADSPVITPQVVEQTSNLVRYKVSWTYQFPANINTKSTYRVFVDSPACRQKRVAVNYSPVQMEAVLGETAQRPIWCYAIPFADRLFGVCQVDNSNTGASPTVVPDVEQGELQLKTFGEAEITDKSCRFVFFKFNEQ